MPIIKLTNSGRDAFALHTGRTTYALRVAPSGHVEHLYYGEKIALDDDSVGFLAERRAFEPGNVIRYYNTDTVTVLEDMMLEASAPGHGDVGEVTVESVRGNGSRTADFLFESAQITDDKPPFDTLPGSYSADGKVEHLTVTLRDKGTNARLELHYFVYPECDVITRSAKLVNEGDEEIGLERLLSMRLDLPKTGYAVTSFHGAWAREMNRSQITLDAGKFVSESHHGYTSSRANPFFMVHDPNATEDSGEVYAFNLIYSGNHYEAVEVNAFGKTRVVSGISPAKFCFTLAPGDSFEAPEAVLTYSRDGFAGQSRNMHAFVREHIVRGEWKGKVRPILLNSWEAGYFDINESSLVSLAKAGRDLGIELFVMDDGWFGERNDDTSSLGDWDANKKKLPGGLSRLCEKINALGMDFGLWVEPEMVNVKSKLYEAHPDWALGVPGEAQSEGRNQRILDLANPEVVDYVCEKMTEVFSSANVAYVKWDMNRIFSDAFSSYLPAEKQGETPHRVICGLYRLLDTLTKRFPHVLFEGCSAGGNRFDLGILCYFPQIWGSDDTDPIVRAHIQEGYSFGYPQECVGAHVSASPNHQTMRETPLETRFNVAAFCSLGYETDLRDLSGTQKDEVKAQTDLYKVWREVFQTGDFYRVQSGNIHEWITVSKDKRRAVGLILQELVAPNTQIHRFFARGLDPDRKYRLTNVPHNVDVKSFGSLINTMAPIHVKQDSLLHDIVAKVVKLSGEKEDAILSGSALMNAGYPLAQAFSATGFSDQVRVFPDFASRMYFIEAIDETGAED